MENLITANFMLMEIRLVFSLYLCKVLITGL